MPFCCPLKGLYLTLFYSCSTYAARFKSWVGGSGYGRNITWENMSAQTPLPSSRLIQG